MFPWAPAVFPDDTPQFVALVGLRMSGQAHLVSHLSSPTQSMDLPMVPARLDPSVRFDDSDSLCSSAFSPLQKGTPKRSESSS